MDHEPGRRWKGGTRRGHTLVEAMVAVNLVMVAAGLLSTSFSYSMHSQAEARRQLEAGRIAGRVLESLRPLPFDNLVLLEDGTLRDAPLIQLPFDVWYGLEERLRSHQLELYLTIRPDQERTASKKVCVTIVSRGLSPHALPEQVPADSTLLRLATVVTEGGIGA